MTVNENENIILIDVDSTLVMNNWEDYEEYRWLDLKYYGQNKRVVAHLEQIKLLKAYKARGFFIRVHTNNGYKWAVEVVKQLGLEAYVDSVETKPARFIDDSKDYRAVIGNRVYIEPEKPV